MDNSEIENNEPTTALRRYLPVAAFAAVGLTLIAFWFWQQSTIVEAPESTAAVEPVTGIMEGPIMSESDPVTLRIPKIAVQAPFEESLGIQTSQEIEVPAGFETVGYYKYGPTPGELGPSVVLGHVDSVAGPAVFYRLGQLEVGDEIFIDRADGTTATFVVEASERHSQSGFPTAKVYSDLNYAGLRLITCSGTFDRGEQRYSHNLIVFAKLVGTSTAVVTE